MGMIIENIGTEVHQNNIYDNTARSRLSRLHTVYVINISESVSANFYQRPTLFDLEAILKKSTLNNMKW